MNRRTGVAFFVPLCFVGLAGCSSAPINKNDGSKPEVTIKVEGPNGYEEQASQDHSDSSEMPPINIMCVVEDPEGVRSLQLEVSDPTVDTVYCAGNLHTISSKVEGLPTPKNISVTADEAPQKLANLIIIPGGVLYTAKPPNEPGPCSPAKNTHITVRCTGTNWSSDAASSFKEKTLQINF